MICPHCEKAGVRSQTFLQNAVETVAYCPIFWDEDGKLHHHNSNVTTAVYRCSRMHRFEVRESGKCWCGWKGATE